MGLLATSLLAGCGALPRSGPSTSEVEDRFQNADNPLGARLVDLTPAAVKVLGAAPPRTTMTALDGLRGDRAVDRLGPGDMLSVSIYEAGPGLFSSTGRQAGGTDATSSAETLPRVQVDRSGRIMIPFAGLVPVAGRTITEAESLIQSRLSEKAAEPQVIISLISGDTNSVIVAGDVKNPGRRPLTMAGEHILDMVALSGGPTHDPSDTLVRIERGGRSAEASLVALQDEPDTNIRVAPQDRILVEYLPRTYLVFGATGKVAQTPFDYKRLSLAEALARSGGLDDNRADPKSIYLFRMTPPSTAQALGLPADRAPVPLIFHADLRDPENFFLMQQVAMRDKDLIYVANARTVQLYKFLQLLYTLVSPAVTARELSP